MQIERVETKYPPISWARRRMPTKTKNLQQVANTKNIYHILIINFSLFFSFTFFLINRETFLYSTVTKCFRLQNKFLIKSNIFFIHFFHHLRNVALNVFQVTFSTCFLCLYLYTRKHSYNPFYNQYLS